MCEDVPYENFPAMAYARTSAGPAGRPGARTFLIGFQKMIRAHICCEFVRVNKFTADIGLAHARFRDTSPFI